MSVKLLGTIVERDGVLVDTLNELEAEHERVKQERKMESIDKPIQFYLVLGYTLEEIADTLIRRYKCGDVLEYFHTMKPVFKSRGRGEVRKMNAIQKLHFKMLVTKALNRHVTNGGAL